MYDASVVAVGNKFTPQYILFIYVPKRNDVIINIQENIEEF